MTPEHAGGSAELEHRIQFECFIADAAARLIAPAPPGRVEYEIERALRELLGIASADCCLLLGGTPDDGMAWVTCAADATGGRSPLGDMNFAALFPWQFERLCRRLEPVVLTDMADLPPEAATDRQSAASMGIRSMLAVPVFGRTGGAHCLMLQSLSETRLWPAYYVARLRVLTEAFVNALSRTLAEETRQQVETRHADLLESVRAIVWRADARTFQTTFVSKEAEAILGYPLESWVKVPGFWRDHIHPDDRQRVEALSTKATREHRKHDFEYRMVVADGRTIWLRNIVNVLVENGQPSELVGVTVDITELKRAEFETARLRYQLTHALRLASLGELAAMLAHELNQPLGAIVSNAESAQVFLNREPPELDQLQVTLRDIAQDGHRAAAVLHRVRVLLQKQVVDVQPLDLRRLADDVVGITRALALSRQIELIDDVPPGLPVPRGDAVQIQQVLLNLIINAMDAVSDRPVKMRQVTIHGASLGAGGIELSVADTGRGIPVDALPLVFDPFFTTKATGMGMGLAICRTIVQAHGGDIHVENNPDGGATVRFTLPVRTEPGQGAR